MYQGIPQRNQEIKEERNQIETIVFNLLSDTTMTRLPNNYEFKENLATGGNYTKITEEPLKFRVLTSPITWWGYFTNENKPKRSRYAFSSTPDIKPDGKAKEFWAFVIWNYTEKKIQVMEITQQTIKKAIWDLVKDVDFGDPKEYDLKISKTGKGKETKYTLLALGKSDFAPEGEEVDAILKEANSIRLEALYDGDDPFKPF